MDERALTRASRFLALVLRHEPGAAGVALDASGWTEVDGLLSGMARRGHAIDRATLDTLVSGAAKTRYALSPDGTRIRALQGHSVDVDLGLSACQPPDILWHGTTASVVPLVAREGLRPMSRRHVHLSADAATARTVGARRGPPVVLRVRAGAMATAGGLFWRSENGVWLTDAVAPGWIDLDP